MCGGRGAFLRERVERPVSGCGDARPSAPPSPRPEDPAIGASAQPASPPVSAARPPPHSGRPEAAASSASRPSPLGLALLFSWPRPAAWGSGQGRAAEAASAVPSPRACCGRSPQHECGKSGSIRLASCLDPSCPGGPRRSWGARRSPRRRKGEWPVKVCTRVPVRPCAPELGGDRGGTCCRAPAPLPPRPPVAPPPSPALGCYAVSMAAAPLDPTFPRRLETIKVKPWGEGREGVATWGEGRRGRRAGAARQARPRPSRRRDSEKPRPSPPPAAEPAGSAAAPVQPRGWRGEDTPSSHIADPGPRTPPGPRAAPVVGPPADRLPSVSVPRSAAPGSDILLGRPCRCCGASAAFLTVRT